MTPRVSVLLPVRDAAETLAECLSSVRAQTLVDHEVVAVDDGSTDTSLDLLRAFAAEDPRVRVLPAARRGLVAALNTALAAARGTHVARLDADDTARADRLELQARRLDRDPAVHVLGSRVLVNREEGNAGMQAYVDWSNRLIDHGPIVRDLFVESPLVHPSVMMRRTDLQALGGWRAFEGPEDYDLWLRAASAGLRFAKLEEPLLFWRDRPSRLTRIDLRYGPDRFLALKLEHLELARLRSRSGVVIWGAGPIGKGWARALRARGHAVVAFVDVDPAKIGQRVLGAPVVGVESAAAYSGALHLAAVGQAGARDRIRAAALGLGLRDGHDLIAVA